MNYLQRLWRAEIIGLVSLAAVSFPIAIVLVLFFDLGSSAPTGFRLLWSVFLGTYLVGFTSVVTYGAPIFAAYMFNLRFRLIYLLGFAALPGFLAFLIFGSDSGLGFMAYGLAVALTMCGIARLWAGRLGGKVT